MTKVDTRATPTHGMVTGVRARGIADGHGHVNLDSGIDAQGRPVPAGGSHIDAKTFNASPNPNNAGRDYSTPDFDPSAEAAAKEGAKQFGYWKVWGGWGLSYGGLV